MQQSPSGEANSHLASQETLCLLWNPKVHYCVHEGLPMILIQRQLNSIHTFPPHFLKIQSNIFHLCLDLPSGLFTSGFRTWKEEIIPVISGEVFCRRMIPASKNKYLNFVHNYLPFTNKNLDGSKLLFSKLLQRPMLNLLLSWQN
jgi:hypothetical protein